MCLLLTIILDSDMVVTELLKHRVAKLAVGTTEEYAHPRLLAIDLGFLQGRSILNGDVGSLILGTTEGI